MNARNSTGAGTSSQPSLRSARQTVSAPPSAASAGTQPRPQVSDHR